MKLKLNQQTSLDISMHMIMELKKNVASRELLATSWRNIKTNI